MMERVDRGADEQTDAQTEAAWEDDRLSHTPNGNSNWCTFKKHCFPVYGLFDSYFTSRLDSPRVPSGSVVKNPPANAGDMGSISGPGRSPGERNGNPLHYSCLENPTDRGAWRLESMGPQRQTGLSS